MKQQERLQALFLREKKGWSIKRIAKHLTVSSSSVSLWCRHTRLTAEQRQQLACNQIANLRVWTTKAKERRENFRQEGFRRAAHDFDFRMICALYWGEGSKTGSKFAITNSDYRMISLFWRWLVNERLLSKAFFSVCYHPENGVQEEQIREWWLEKLPGASISNCRKFIVKDTSSAKIKNVGKLPYGTVTVGVCSVEHQCQVLGGIDFLSNIDFNRSEINDEDV